MISGALSSGALQRFDPVARLDHVESRELKILGVHLARVGIVVDDEDTRTLTFGFHFRPLSCISAPDGSTSVNVDPLPTWLRKVMLPSSI